MDKSRAADTFHEGAVQRTFIPHPKVELYPTNSLGRKLVPNVLYHVFLKFPLLYWASWAAQVLVQHSDNILYHLWNKLPPHLVNVKKFPF